MFSFVVKIPVDRGLSGTHQENRNASDFYDSYDTELGSPGTDWDAYFCTFSYIVRTGDRKNPRFLRSLRHMRTRLKHESQIIVFKSRNGLVPQYLFDRFIANSSDSSYNLRNTATDLKSFL